MFGAMKHAFPQKISVDEINDITNVNYPPLYFLRVLSQMLKQSEPSHGEIM